MLIRNITPSDLSGLASPLAIILSLAAFANTLFNNRRQRKMEAMRAVSDFIQQYNCIIDFVPKGQKIATLNDISKDLKSDDPRSDFYLVPYVVNSGPLQGESRHEGNTGVIANSSDSERFPTFCESDSFFLRYWILQFAQYVSFKQGVLPREIYIVWMRSNAEVNKNGSYWITASAFKRGHNMCQGIFEDTNEKRLRDFLDFTKDLFDGQKSSTHGLHGRWFMWHLEEDKIIADEASNFTSLHSVEEDCSTRVD